MLVVFILCAIYIIRILYVRKVAPTGNTDNVRLFLRITYVISSIVSLLGGIFYLISGSLVFGIIFVVYAPLGIINWKHPELSMRMDMWTRGSFTDLPSQEITITKSQLGKQKYSGSDKIMQVIDNLSENNFLIDENVNYEGQKFKFVAKKTYPIPEIPMAQQNIYLIFSEFSYLNMSTLEDFSNIAYRYIRSPFKNRQIYKGGNRCIPIAIVSTLSPVLSKALTASRIKTHFYLFASIQEIPIIWCPNENKVAYSNHIPFGGRMFIYGLRDFIEQLLINEDDS